MVTIDGVETNQLVPLKKRKSMQQSNVQDDENIQTNQIPLDSESKNTQDVLFDHSVEFEKAMAPSAGRHLVINTFGLAMLSGEEFE